MEMQGIDFRGIRRERVQLDDPNRADHGLCSGPEQTRPERSRNGFNTTDRHVSIDVPSVCGGSEQCNMISVQRDYLMIRTTIIGASNAIRMKDTSVALAAAWRGPVKVICNQEVAMEQLAANLRDDTSTTEEILAFNALPYGQGKTKEKKHYLY